ncbi:MAG: FtsW/RodA/SpoVE family cell cycle protein [Clostridium sp.]|nr:FtsW/RodA/SpoVE family cell cycle protein [Clostridium sp.]MCM1547840.1 FtsW/RodA/SpoVE family cell cycle protein [Ruminococcus sp.]
MNSVLKKFSDYFRKLDKGLIICVTACAVISVILLYSIFKNNLEQIDRGVYITQFVGTLLGIAACLVVARLDYHSISRLWFLYAPFTLALVLLTFTGLGMQVDGADDRAWLNLGFMTIQPSEMLKLAFIMSFSFHISKVEDNINKPLNMLFLLIHGAVPVGLIVLQGDYGTAIVFIVMFVVMLFSAGISVKYIIFACALTPPAIYILWKYILQSLHKNRILVLIHPGTDPMGLEYQQNLGLASLGSGGVFGKGLFSKDEYVEVPKIHNDFIFAYIGQAFGFVGAIVIIVMLAYICMRVLADSRNTMDKLGKLICLGTFAMLFTHCFMNIGMVLKVMPVVGIPLPFFSAGGTALVSMYVAIGMVMSCVTHNDKKYRMFYDD